MTRQERLTAVQLVFSLVILVLLGYTLHAQHEVFKLGQERLEVTRAQSASFDRIERELHRLNHEEGCEP